MSTRSPGPWVFVESVIHSDAYKPHEADLGGFRAANGKWVCRFGDSTTYYPSHGDPPSEDDARLIAAAPELLETLQIARSYMAHTNWCNETTNGVDGDCECGHALHLERVNAVIDKATGAA